MDFGTFADFTPEQFAVESAREVLLGREVELQQKNYDSMKEYADSCAQAFDQQCGEYHRLVEKLDAQDLANPHRNL